MISASDIENRIVSIGVTGPLGQAVIYTTALSGTPASFRGVLSRDALETLSETGVPMRVERAELTIYAGDLAAAPVKGDALTVGGASWTVADVKRDGQAAYILTLRGA